MTEKSIAKVEKKDMSVESIITQAVTSGASVETLEKLLALRKEYRADQAREAFVTAMSEFQAECPVIKKTKKVMNKDGATVRYMFAPIDSIVEQIKKPLKDSGLSYRWEVKQDKQQVKAVCIVTHILGHSESSDFDVGVDSEGYMTAPQKLASALTFAKRYSLCNVLGISTGDEDTDATDVNKQKTAKNPLAKITFLLRTLGKESKDKTENRATVEKLTGMKLEDKNLDEIVGRMELLVSEQNDGVDTK
jgi:hypothetical protein